MSSAARKTQLTPITGAPPAALSVAEYLGPAEVTAVHGGEVEVELPGGAPARAAMALAFPYVPCPGDELLIIGRGGDHYVIGVLRGSGQSVFSFPGDVSLRAEGGALRLSGDEVEIAGRDVSLHAEALRVVAGSVVEKLRSLYQRISGPMSVHAQQAHAVVEGASVTQARSAAIVTEETVTINGRQVHLG